MIHLYTEKCKYIKVLKIHFCYSCLVFYLGVKKRKVTFYARLITRDFNVRSNFTNPSSTQNCKSNYTFVERGRAKWAHHVRRSDSPSPHFSGSFREAQQQVSGHPAQRVCGEELKTETTERERGQHTGQWGRRRRGREEEDKWTGSAGRCVSESIKYNWSEPSAPTSRGVTSCRAPLPNMAKCIKLKQGGFFFKLSLG